MVRAPCEQVFAAWTDYDAWPSFSGLFTHVDVLERSANAVRVGAQIKLMGRTSTRTERHILTPPREVRVEGETEGAVNTTSVRSSRSRTELASPQRSTSSSVR